MCTRIFDGIEEFDGLVGKTVSWNQLPNESLDILAVWSSLFERLAHHAGNTDSCVSSNTHRHMPASKYLYGSLLLLLRYGYTDVLEEGRAYAFWCHDAFGKDVGKNELTDAVRYLHVKSSFLRTFCFPF